MEREYSLSNRGLSHTELLPSRLYRQLQRKIHFKNQQREPENLWLKTAHHHILKMLQQTPTRIQLKTSFSLCGETSGEMDKQKEYQVSTHPAPNFYKCLCQLMKLSGFNLNSTRFSSCLFLCSSQVSNHLSSK